MSKDLWAIKVYLATHDATLVALDAPHARRG